MQGFFPSSTTISSDPRTSLPHLLTPACGECGMYRTCHSPKMPVDGKGQKGILLVGEAPGETEDLENRPFCGKAGQRLERSLSGLGIDMRQDCWITNAVRCRPIKNKTPDEKKIDACRPNLLRTIEELKPAVTILLGGSAVRSLVSYAWKEDPGAMTMWAGWQIPCQKPNTWICPTYHPSYLERMQSVVLDRYFDQHLEAAVQLESRPWNKIPDRASEVLRIYDPEKAKRWIAEFTRSLDPTAADYETNALKPEYKGAKILSCALSSKKVGTVSFPWSKAVFGAMSEFWLSDTPKIASSLKFEERWTRWFFKHGVRRWCWDTMLAAHVLNCNPGITSVKFQAFVLLGVGEYNEHIEPFLQAAKGRTINQAEFEISIEQLLQYGGEDALYELLVARAQWTSFGGLSKQRK